MIAPLRCTRAESINLANDTIQAETRPQPRFVFFLDSVPLGQAARIRAP